MIDSCYLGDVRDGLRAFAAGGVRARTCVTSPPYWGLRDYGTAAWDGGDESCGHVAKRMDMASGWTQNSQRAGRTAPPDIQYRDECGKCGATRVDRQIGLEQTPTEYVERMVEVFRLVRDVLSDDGTLWLNLGDSYAGSWGAQGRSGSMADRSVVSARQIDAHPQRASNTGTIREPGLKPKDLVGIPWRVALALQADGWYLRSDIIWHKPNPMPESIEDRPTKAHEYLFLLAKSERYFYDHEAIKEQSADPIGSEKRYESAFGGPKARAPVGDTGIDTRTRPEGMREFAGTRNRRTVWTIPTAPYAGAHFATFPVALVEPCIMAGTSSRGRCPKCSAPWTRQVETERHFSSGSGRAGNLPNGKNGPALQGNGENHGDVRMGPTIVSCTVGWEPGCSCGCDPIPDVVLDPFMGSGTTAQVAQALGRRWIGCELNPEYHALQAKRTAQQGLALA